MTGGGQIKRIWENALITIGYPIVSLQCHVGWFAVDECFAAQGIPMMLNPLDSQGVYGVLIG